MSHRKSPFFNYPSLPNATQPDYGIINLIIFLRFPLFGVYSGEKISDKNLVDLVFIQEKKYLIKIWLIVVEFNVIEVNFN